MRMSSRPLPSHFSAYVWRVGTLTIVLSIASMSELSTEAMASGATMKRSFSAVDRGRMGGVGVTEMDGACGAVAPPAAVGVELECCAERGPGVGPRARRVMRGEGASKVKMGSVAVDMA
eukprot:3208627-Pleurochrysis_carterae.AAC.2